MKRIFDLLTAILLVLVLSLPMIIIFLLLTLISEDSAIYWSERIGKNNTIFKMPKFRTMKKDTPTVASHMIKNPEKHLLPFGKFLRNLSLDELPQLFSVIKGDLSLVGPRPALPSQLEIIKFRQNNDIDKILPGITGWAQVNGRDKISIDEKLYFDKEYLKKQSFTFDLKILCLTFLKVVKKENISH